MPSENAINTKFAQLTQKAIAENQNQEYFRIQVQKQLAPTEDPTLNIQSLRAITKSHKAENESLPFDSSTLPNDIILTVINAINSKKATPPEEQAIGHFTRRKLKKLSTWHKWEAGERKQLDQFTQIYRCSEKQSSRRMIRVL